MTRRPRGYWKDWRNIVAAVLPLIKQLGYFPPQAEMRKAGYSALSRALRDFHGGHDAAARRLGVPTKREMNMIPLKDQTIFARGIAYYTSRCYFPSRVELLSMGRSDLVTAIRKYHGGFTAAARMMNLPTYNEFHGINEAGHWTEDRIIDEYLTCIFKYRFKHWPTPGDLRLKGHGPLARAIQKIGYRELRKKLSAAGLELDHKKRSIAHLKPFALKYPINPTVFEESELKYYLIGLVSADGFLLIKKNELAVELCLNKADEDILTALRDRISPGRPLHRKPHTNSQSDAVRLKINSRELVDMLTRYMPAKWKSLHMAFPEHIPDEHFQHYLRGIIDGDGNICITKNQRIFTGKARHYHVIRLRILGTQDFLSGLVGRIEKILGIKAVKVTKRPHENVHEIQYSGRHAREVLNYVYQDCTLYLKRKLRTWQLLRDLSPTELARRYGTPDGRYNTLAKKHILTSNE